MWVVGFLQLDFEMKENKFCLHLSDNNYQTLEEAINVCRTNESCTAIQDIYCDKLGKFQLCYSQQGYSQDSSDYGTCVYKKKTGK